MEFLRQKFTIFAIGMAMFTMFFGAGNIVFPLLVGKVFQGQVSYALLGLIITAVGVPFIGLISMTLYEGNWRHFFEKLGKIPSLILVVLLMALMGPFGATPRCLALSYSTAAMFFPGTNLILFSLISCVVLYVLTIKKDRLAALLGPVLTPFFIITMGIIVVKGLLTPVDAIAMTDYSEMTAFFEGLHSGYQTMDLIGAFFFCTVVVQGLVRSAIVNGSFHRKQFLKNTLLSSLVGAVLLTVVYVGMSLVAAKHAVSLSDVPIEALLGTIALQVLGPYGGVLTCIAVILACFTTAMALISIFAEFLSRDILQGKISYKQALVITLAITFCVSTLEFGGIARLLAPIVEVLYPALLALSVVNIVKKMWSVSLARGDVPTVL